MECADLRVRGRIREAAAEARRAESARIEKACATAPDRRCDVVKLYHGGQYHLYTYKKYTDVRLVMAPEQQAAFFGGDYDNFTYPRHDIDMSFVRAYENGRPAEPAAYLSWSRAGAGDGDLVFISGHPGRTSRLKTIAQLEASRDVLQPAYLAWLRSYLEAARHYAARGGEQERRARGLIFGLENSIKARSGFLAALEDKKGLATLRAAEKALRARVGADATLAAQVGDPWAAVAKAQQRELERADEELYVQLRGSQLLRIAGMIVRYVDETRKPNGARLEEYRDSSLASLKNRLFSPAPIYDDLEEATLAAQLERAREVLGADHPFVKAALDGQSPAEAARKAIEGTTLHDVAARKALVAGGPEAVEASKDTMIALARRIDPQVYALRKWNEDEIEAVYDRAGEKLGQARWAVFGTKTYPDATFTLRLAYGVVKGFPAEGTRVPPFTTFYGLFDRSLAFGGQAPWDLAPRVAEARDRLALSTPLNFAFTGDIIGGNSGSPVVNRASEVVGLVFDGNIESLAYEYYYTDDRARSVAVDSRGIIEALKTIYGADALVGELLGSTR